jgi:hypothetical protein
LLCWSDVVVCVIGICILRLCWSDFFVRIFDVCILWPGSVGCFDGIDVFLVLVVDYRRLRENVMSWNQFR